jgi:hypothetical protein
MYFGSGFWLGHVGRRLSPFPTYGSGRSTAEHSGWQGRLSSSSEYQQLVDTNQLLASRNIQIISATYKFGSPVMPMEKIHQNLQPQYSEQKDRIG